MIKYILTIVSFILCTGLMAQVTYVKQEYCKKKDIEILTGDSIPVGHAVLLIGSFDKNEIGRSIKDLSKKQIKKMKTYCKWRNSCKVFIAFKQVEDFSITPENYTEEQAELYRQKQRSKIHFYVLAPVYELNCL